MKKFLQMTICMTITAMLFIGLSAQNERGAPNEKVLYHYYLNDDNSADSFRGPTSETIFTVKNSPYPAHKGTVANPFGTSIGNTGGAVQCLEYINGVIYGVRWSGGNQFGTVNPATGTFNVIKPNFHVQGTDGASMAYNPVDGKTYVFPWTGQAPEATRFGTVDLTTGDFTTIADFGTTGPTYYAAIDEDGTCYAVKNLSNEFGTINLANGSFTVKATLSGITSINYIQDLSFDRETGELYWLGKADVGAKDFYWKIDKATGALTNLGSNPFDAQGFCILNWYLPKECPAVTNLNAVQEEMKAKITWNAPAETADLTGYKIYNGETEIGNVPTGETIFTTVNLDAGDYTFGVEAIYSNGCIPKKVTTTLTIVPPPPPPCKPVINVKGEYDAEKKEILVEWEAPEGDITPTGYEFFKEGISLGIKTETEYIDDVSELLPDEYEYEYCVLPVYAEGVCDDADLNKVCEKVSFIILGIKDFTPTFSILPNPANNDIIISAKGNFNNIEILSFLGQVVLSQSNKGNKAKLDISNLTNGVYFVRITSQNGTSVQKFVKQ